MTAMKRIIILVSPAGRKLWRLRIKHDKINRTYARQADAIAYGRAAGRDFKAQGLLAELIIMRADGTFSPRGSTYGRDPGQSHG